MYTRILLINKYFKEKYKNKFFYNLAKKRYYKKHLKRIFNSIRENYFIFKYDNLVELYKLLEDIGYDNYTYIVDDDYLYNTIILQEPGIIKIRIDIALEEHTVILSVKEEILKYELKYKFNGKLKYNMYNEESKDKDQELITLCNLLLINVLINKLEALYWEFNSNGEAKVDIELGAQYKNLINELIEMEKSKIKE